MRLARSSSRRGSSAWTPRSARSRERRGGLDTAPTASSVPPSRSDAIDSPALTSPALSGRLAGARIILVVGESDTGKTTLVRDLANALHARHTTVALVDADLGQSEIGPPTTVGLGRMTRPVARPSNADPIALRFIGTTSPARDALATVVATRQLVDRAAALGVDHVIVDTGGLVRGDLGRRLKQAKIDAVSPDAVIALQRGGECEPILRAYARSPRPVIVRLPAAPVVRRRTPDERRRHRERALAAHLAGARAVALDLGRVVLRSPALFAGPSLSDAELSEGEDAVGEELVWAERRGGEVAVVTRTEIDESAARALSRRLHASGLVRHALEDLEGMLAGLDDESLDTLGLGVVVALDLRAARITVETAVDPTRIAAVAIGRERYRQASGAPLVSNRGP